MIACTARILKGLIVCAFLSCGDKKPEMPILARSGNLVLDNHWFIAGPSVQTEAELNAFRKSDQVVIVTVNNAPIGEIELNVMVTPSGGNDGKPTNLPDSSTYLEVEYRSTHLMKIQAREGAQDGNSCMHGGIHPAADLPASPTSYTVLRIPWSNFEWTDASGRSLNIHNLCKFNFVNYNPVAGAQLELRSVKIENFK